MYKVYYTKQAVKDAKLVQNSPLKEKVKLLLGLLSSDPLQSPPPYKKLLGDLEGCYSRRINLQHRLFYQVNKADKWVKVLRIWPHYGE